VNKNAQNELNWGLCVHSTQYRKGAVALCEYNCQLKFSVFCLHSVMYNTNEDRIVVCSDEFSYTHTYIHVLCMNIWPNSGWNSAGGRMALASIIDPTRETADDVILTGVILTA
jgi:hypothetical protein